MTDKQIRVIHIAIVFIIVTILGIAIFKVVRWGTTSDNVLESIETDDDFSTEAEDHIALVDPRALKDREDDGVTTVVMLGDNTLSDYPDADGISAQVGELANATVYNISFAGARMATKNVDYTDDNPEDAFSLYWLSRCIASGDYDLLTNKMDLTPYMDDRYEETIELLQTIDFETVDIITFLYGPHDYLDGTVITDPNDYNSHITYSGALNEAALIIKEAFPHIRLIAVSPTFAMVDDGTGQLVGSDLHNTGYGALPSYMVAAKNIAADWANISYVDNIYGLPFNFETYPDYLEDNLYPNATARTLIAERIATMISHSVN